MNLSVLPLDVCDRLLTTISDFYTLQCAVLSCKSLQEAYKIRIASIRYAVARRVVGSALKHALLLARIKLFLEREDHNETTGRTIIEWLVDDNAFERHFGPGISPEEARLLVKLSSVINRLEVVYCVRYEDWDTTTSVLNFQERKEFQLSMYQAWILNTLAASKLLCFIQDKTLFANVWTVMSTEEMEKIARAKYFMDDVLDAFTNRFIWQGRFVSHFLDPEEVVFIMYCTVEQFRGFVAGHFPSNTITEDLEDHIYHSFTAVLSARKDLENENAIFGICKRDILRSPCERCNEAQYLFSINNWEWWEKFGHAEWQFHLPGNLQHNQYVGRLLESSIHNETSANYARMIGEMFDGLNDIGEGAEWRVEGRYCRNCLHRFIVENLYSWFIKKLVRDGYKFKDNCWYGWNCRTQTHKYSHALKLNHLCEPGSRDDTSKSSTAAADELAVQGGSDDDSDDEDDDYEEDSD